MSLTWTREVVLFLTSGDMHVPVIADAEHTYDSNTAQTIQLDAQGSALYYFPALLSGSQQTALLDELDASLRRCQSRPHPFGLCPLASQCGHEQWFCMGPKLRANSRWRRFSLSLSLSFSLSLSLSLSLSVGCVLCGH